MSTKQMYFSILIFLIFINVVIFLKSSTTLVVAQRETIRRILQTEEAAQTPVLNAKNRLRVSENYSGNLPDIYLSDKLRKPKGLNKTCALFPKIFALEFNNDNWQMQKTSNGTFYLFSAYLDERTDNQTIRIIGLFDKYGPERMFYCQFWYPKTDSPKVVRSETPLWMFRRGWGADKDGFLHPYIITCPLVRFQNETPTSVSLVDSVCSNSTNNLKISSKAAVEEKKNFVVCVKGLIFPFEDKTTRLVEWIELVRILGAEKIHFYEFSVHPNVRKVLDYYIAQDFVELTPVSIAGDVSNDPYLQQLYLREKTIQRRLQEVIPYNDCLYKHLREFRYVVLLDTDEVIVPSEGNWIQLIKVLEEKSSEISTFLARNVYFLDSYLHQHDWFEGIPRHMHMLQHVWRTESYTNSGHFVKGFHRTGRVLALHNHFPIACLKQCFNKEMDVKVAHLQHYRGDCAAGVTQCEVMKNNSVMDMRLWNFKEELIDRVENTLENLGFWQ